MVKKILGPLLLVALVAGVGGTIFLAAKQRMVERQIVVLRGLIGSEKEDFFKDPRVVELLKKAYLEVHVATAGSREIATTDLSRYDFVSPSGLPSAEKIRQSHNTAAVYEMFFTPMVLASWEPITDILVKNNVARKEGEYYTLNMHAFLSLVEQGKKWSELQSSHAYPVDKSILISSTDVRSSNSAAMYLSLASFVLNGNNVVQEKDIPAVLPKVSPLFSKQGFQAGSSAVPFNDYLVMGMGKAPLVMIYESQFIYQAVNTKNIRPEMVLIYPEPTLYTKHFLITLGHSKNVESANLLGKLLSNDPELQGRANLYRIAEALQKLEIEHGYRNADRAYFMQFIDGHGVVVADNLVNVIDPPSYEVLEKLIEGIAKSY